MLGFVENWRLAKKMLVAFVFLGVLAGAIAVNGIVSNTEMSRVATRHVEHGVRGLSGLADIISDIKELRIVVYSLSLIHI